ncbi:MAG: hypothetical protein QM831_04265 [Kofleriaceae bacterium]
MNESNRPVIVRMIGVGIMACGVWRAVATNQSAWLALGLLGAIVAVVGAVMRGSSARRSWHRQAPAVVDDHGEAPFRDDLRARRSRIAALEHELEVLHAIDR